MPRGVYPRKKKSGLAATPKPTAAAPDLAKLFAQIRAAKTWYEDRVVVLGTALETLEALES